MEHISQLRSVTRHMGSHSVTCHPTQVNTPRLHPSQTSTQRNVKSSAVKQCCQTSNIAAKQASLD